tara:strand:- start:992 stop:1282 length:291 start_codon:yes stop_codon:yes gene_type:complete
MKKPISKPRNFDNLLKSSINAAESIETSEQDMSVINDYLAEHLKSFVLLGYDIKGESVVIVSGKTPQDYDAIETLLRRVGDINFFKDVQEQTNTNE